MSASWTTSGSMSVAVGEMCGAGTTNAGLRSGGMNTSSQAVTSCEEFNGSTWSSGGNLAVAKRRVYGNGGTQTSALITAGSASNDVGQGGACEEYDGTSWANGGEVTYSYVTPIGGNQNSAISAGGYSGGNTTNTQEYNGTSWSAGGSISVARRVNPMNGTSESNAMVVGGYTTGASSSTEKYNGTSWSDAGNLPAGNYVSGTAGNSAGAIDGGGAYTAGTSSVYSGTAWASSASMVADRQEVCGFGERTSAVVCGGSTDGSASFNANAYIFSDPPFDYDFKFTNMI